MALGAVEDSVRIGLDTETTGLSPVEDRVRLLSLAPDRAGAAEGGDRTVYLIDCNHTDPAPLFGPLAERELVLHNAESEVAAS
jgi:hypothetical protein